MERTIKVGLVFEFYPNGEHADLFEGMTEDEVIKSATRMATEDIYASTQNGEVERQVFIEDSEGSLTLKLTPYQEDTLRGYLGEILATDANDAIEEIYQQLTDAEY